jgi:hypothetical protein
MEFLRQTIDFERLSNIPSGDPHSDLNDAFIKQQL